MSPRYVKHNGRFILIDRPSVARRVLRYYGPGALVLLALTALSFGGFLLLAWLTRGAGS